MVVVAKHSRLFCSMETLSYHDLSLVSKFESSWTLGNERKSLVQKKHYSKYLKILAHLNFRLFCNDRNESRFECERNRNNGDLQS
jgi:hypothetical protein